MIWYVAYGSNLDAQRFRHYLTGGTPPGAARAVAGARDASPPVDERAVTVPGRMFFAWESPTWGAGVSFFDPDPRPDPEDGPRADAEPSRVLGRAYRITEGQFADVAAQEMHRDPGEDLDLRTVLAERRHSTGPGRYETLLLLGELEGEPMLTFSADDPAALERNAPAAAYLRLVARGLRDTHGLTPEQVAEHLCATDGIGDWTPAAVAGLLD